MARVFISHSSDDKTGLIEPLYEYVRSRGHEVWYDTESVSFGDPISLTISEGLSQADVFLVGISDNFNRSRWCQRELGAIISNSVETSKRIVIIQVDNAAIPAIISDFHHIKHSRTSRELVPLFEKIDKALSAHPASHAPDLKVTSEMLVTRIFKADREGNVGANLLGKAPRPIMDSPENEGVILIKPGGTFYAPCLQELFARILSRCVVRQLRLFNADSIRNRGLFEKQYVTPTKIANGEISLGEDDLRKIRAIYDRPEFARKYGANYSDDLIIPALHLCRDPYNLSPGSVSEMWEKGRAKELFWNERWDGLNKIGYQKTVFPITCDQFSDPGVRIVLNGFIPGYRDLFVRPESRAIAVHVSSNHPWKKIRDEVVGGKSNPASCHAGSIRRDAYEKRIPLRPDDDLVNGQRNVCHCSATLFDGMRELIHWFEYPPGETLLAQILELKSIPLQEVLDLPEEKILPNISWTTRDDTVSRILFEVRHLVVKDELQGAGAKKQIKVAEYATKANVGQWVIQNSNELSSFIQNCLRLEVAGEDFYLNAIAEMFESAHERSRFFAVARGIREHAARSVGGDSPDVLAEAYRIAASDLLILQSPIYEKEIEGGGDLFQASVFSELPEQAMDCALRTQTNLVKEAATLKRSESKGRPSMTIQNTPAWKEFLSRITVIESKRSSAIGLILCGGRSTRMCSTIPKPALPFRDRLLFNAVLDVIKKALNAETAFYAAVGFRSTVVRRALGHKVNYLEYPKTLGLAFRVATCLETLRNNEGLVVLAYTDMPLISSKCVADLVRLVDGNKMTFGLITSQARHLSGHIEEDDGRVKRVIQSRLNPEKCFHGMLRDAGVYVFHNTPELRKALLSIRNNNIRAEFIFADIVEILSKQNWEIVTVMEEPERAQGINTASDLLLLASGASTANAEIGRIRSSLHENYNVTVPEFMDVETFRASASAHLGPVHFFHWWDRNW